MTTTTTTDNKSIGGSQYLARYIRNVQQANEATAAQYEYRLSRFEKYVAMAYKEEQQQQQNHRSCMYEPRMQITESKLIRFMIILFFVFFEIL